MRWTRMLSVLVVGWLGAPGCTRPLTQRCDFDEQCDDHEVCSNAGDHHRAGLCILEPDAAPPDMAVVDAAASDAGTDGGTDAN